jgi:hypothetical protein
MPDQRWSVLECTADNSDGDDIRYIILLHWQAGSDPNLG